MAFTGKIIPRESLCRCILCFFFNDTATTEIYTLSLHDALPITPDEMKSRSERCLGLIDGAYPKEMVSDEKDRSASVSEEGRRGGDRPGFSSPPPRVPPPPPPPPAPPPPPPPPPKKNLPPTAGARVGGGGAQGWPAPGKGKVFLGGVG